ncbi:MAG: anion permease [Deltaproteobacteria bacterium]|nr:anion permease [Deltaproteobacteria bacterium]
MFDFSPVGVGVALAGLLFISLIGWRLTPRREGQSAPEELFEIDTYISELLMVGTMLLSNVVNNAAATVLMAPIAINLANGMGVSADPLLMGVAIGASCAFLTPIGHQSNALVMAPGGYQFGDYWHLGLPLSLVVIVVALPLILSFWPL